MPGVVIELITALHNKICLSGWVELELAGLVLLSKTVALSIGSIKTLS